MTLTEQWKKGELSIGVYYIKHCGDYETDQWHGDYWENSWSENVEEVLAPVPSYEEWQELIDKKYWCNARAKNLLEKNQHLKELLSFCREMLEEYRFSEGDFTIGNIDTSLLLNMIDNAIGENNEKKSIL